MRSPPMVAALLLGLMSATGLSMASHASCGAPTVGDTYNGIWAGPSCVGVSNSTDNECPGNDSHQDVGPVTVVMWSAPCGSGAWVHLPEL